MNTTKAIAAAQKYLGAEATALSFNGLMLQVANKYLTADRTALADAALDALNQYLTNDRRALSDAMYDAAIQYLAGSPTNGDAISAALDKYLLAYTSFQSNISALALNGARTWNGQALVGKYTVTPTTTSQGNLVGTSWLDAFRYGTGSSISRAVQHGFPDATAFNTYVTNQTMAYVEIAAVADAAVPALDRNGYLSTADVATGASAKIVDLIYWDGNQGQRMNPSTGTGPVPYVV